MASLTQWTWTWTNLGDSEGQGSLVCYRLCVPKTWTQLSDWTTIKSLLPESMTLITAQVVNLDFLWLTAMRWPSALPGQSEMQGRGFYPSLVLRSPPVSMGCQGRWHANSNETPLPLPASGISGGSVGHLDFYPHLAIMRWRHLSPTAQCQRRPATIEDLKKIHSVIIYYPKCLGQN